MAANNAVADVILKISLDDSNINGQIKNGTSAVASGAGSVFGNMLKAGLMTSAITAGISLVNKFVNTLVSGSQEAYRIQLEAEQKLETIMRQRMKSTEAEIQQIKDLASELQGIGIIGDEVTLSGAQQLATFLKQEESLKTLMPAMQNLIAQQKGFNASASDAVNVSNLMGKAMMGQTSALTRVGIVFTEAQEQVLKFGTEEEKAATLAQVITDNVGEMNEALANTTYGRQIQLSNAFGDVKEKVGDLITILKSNFTDVMMEVVAWLDRAVDRAIDFAVALGKFLEELGLKKPTEDVEAMNNSLTETEEILEEVKKTTGELAGFDQFNLLGGNEANTEMSVELDSNGFTKNANDVGNGMDGINEKIKEGINIFTDLFNKIKESDIFKKLCESLQEFINEQVPAFKEACNNMKETLSDLWNWISKDVLRQENLTFVGFLIDYIDYCKDYLVEAITFIVNGGAKIIGVLGATAQIFGELITGTINLAVDIFTHGFEIIATIVEEFGNFMMDFFRLMGEGFQGIGEMIENVGEKGIFEGPSDDFEGFAMFGVPLIETVESAERRQSQAQTTNTTEAAIGGITFSPTITIGGDQILDYTIEGINAKSAIKGYSVIN